MRKTLLTLAATGSLLLAGCNVPTEATATPAPHWTVTAKASAKVPRPTRTATPAPRWPTQTATATRSPIPHRTVTATATRCAG